MIGVQSAGAMTAHTVRDVQEEETSDTCNFTHSINWKGDLFFEKSIVRETGRGLCNFLHLRLRTLTRESSIKTRYEPSSKRAATV